MRKILIVEDEPAYAALLYATLAKTYQVLEAQDGKQGLDMALQKRPDLILLDVRIPVMNGMTMLNELRKDVYGKTVKVILLTNHEPDDTIIRKAIRDQPAYYWIKCDIELDEIVERIDELLS